MIVFFAFRGEALAAGVGTGIRTREELMLGVGFTQKQVSTLNDNNNNTSGGFTPEATSPDKKRPRVNPQTRRISMFCPKKSITFRGDHLF